MKKHNFVNIQSAALTGASAVGDWIKDFNDVFYLPLEFGIVPGYGCNFCNSIIESGYKLSDDLLKTYSYSIEEALIHCDYLKCSNFITHCHDPYTDDEIAVLKNKLRCVSRDFLKDCYCIHNDNSIFGKIKKNILYIHKRDIHKLMKKFFLNFCNVFSDKNIFVSMNFFNNHKTEFFIEYSHFFYGLKMIFVYRDPRDTFCSWIKHKWIKDEDIEKFLAHYKSAYSEYPHDHKKIIDISFEDFVLNHEAVSQKILKFISVSKNSKVNNPKYNLEYSRTKIGFWKSYPNQKIMDKIAVELKDYLYEA